MKLTVEKISFSSKKKCICVDDKSRPGSPPVGYGRNLKEAIGDFFINNSSSFNIEYDIKKSAQKEIKKLWDDYEKQR